MDYLRVSYSTNAQFGATDPTLGRIAWYRAAPGAKVFPYPHCFGSVIWDGDSPPFTGAGEVVGATRSWKSNAGPPFPGQEFHGEPSWFLSGVPQEVIDTEAPPAKCVYVPIVTTIPFTVCTCEGVDTTLAIS